ncbi:MAG: SDR family oxidoreductase [Alphaproteobacteria bacterium]|nr:MAG: SDR family oxidoreductase [Alphaproteobacteria bacterium]
MPRSPCPRPMPAPIPRCAPGPSSPGAEPMTLADRIIAVTGASNGIGAAIAATLGREGAHVIAHYGHDRAGAEAATAGIPAGRRRLIGADFAEPAAADRFWAEALAWRGRIDVLVLNAAVMRLAGGIDDDDAAWDRVWAEALQVNTLAPARLMRHAVRHWLAGGGGTLIAMSSWVVQRGSSNPAGIAYAASKAALSAAVKTVARAHARDGILAYTVSPGVVRTRMSEESAATLGGEAAVSAGLAMGEWIPPEELAELVAFLATGRVRHLTGATIDVNGASFIR